MSNNKKKMMIQKMISIVLLLFLFQQPVISQTNFIPLMADHAFFRSQPANNYLEIYTSLFQKDLQYVKTSEKLKALYLLTTQILQKSIQTESLIDSLREIKTDRQFVSIFACELPAGNYQSKITIEDLNSGGRGEYLFELRSPAFSQDSLTLSDIELAYDISNEISESDFNKNGKYILPNAAGSYSILTPLLLFYVEIYNLQYDSIISGEYSSTCFITNFQGDTLRKFLGKIQKKPGSSAVLVDGFNIVTLPAGIYYLNLEVQDRQTQLITRARKKFAYYKPERKPIAQTGNAGNRERETAILEQYGQWSERELDQEFEKARFTASEDEIKIYRTLDSSSKKNFLYQFWQTRSTANPNFKTDYFERVQLTESLFGNSRIKGWQTDRGRILLQYGKPDEWNKYYMEPDKKPYEIWMYHGLETGVQFVFGDLQGFGEFELLHSTHSKELHNPFWERLVTKAESSVGFDSRNDFQF
jgi:GWxTD domain-containing protein